MAVSRGRSPQDAHAPVLAAAGLTAGDAAKAAGWSEVMYSRCRSGRSTVKEDHALALQRVTRSETFPEGIQPNVTFWPAGVKKIVKT